MYGNNAQIGVSTESIQQTKQQANAHMGLPVEISPPPKKAKLCAGREVAASRLRAALKEAVVHCPVAAL